MESGTLLEITNVSKSFSGVKVLKNITLSLGKGEVHAVVGENGAGKSTLIKILSGAYRRDEGSVTVGNAKIEEITPRIAHDLGIYTIYQERNLILELSVAENILLGNIPVTGMGSVKWRDLYARAGNILDRYNLKVDPKSIVRSLSSADQQSVEIAKALYKNVKIVIMDEPTASLTKSEIDNLFTLIRNLKKSGVSVIYISHRLDEIFEIADYVTVLRDGEKILCAETTRITKAGLVKAMVGEDLTFTTMENAEIGELLLEAEHVSRSGWFDEASLKLHRGEIFGIGGMVGSGRTSLVRVLAGIDKPDSGFMRFKGRKLPVKGISDYIALGICFIPEDRDASGLIGVMSVAGNTTLASLHKIMRGARLDLGREKTEARRFTASLGIAAKSVGQEVQTLSGGNRQKVMLSKWLFRGFEVIIMDEPTQGVDVGAREEIHRIMKSLAMEGKGIIMVSSDLEELLNMSSRVAVMNNGKIIAVLDTKDATPEEVISYAIGKTGHESQRFT